MWPNPLETADLITFNEEIIDGKIDFFVQWMFLSHFLFFDSLVEKLLVHMKWFSHIKHLKMNTDHLSQGV